jgi:hypothetical protein
MNFGRLKRLLQDWMMCMLLKLLIAWKPIILDVSMLLNFGERSLKITNINPVSKSNLFDICPQKF